MIATLLMVAGLGIALHGAWIPVKAQLAEVLLHRAWKVVLNGGGDAKPWPWADTHPVASLRIDRVGIDSIVLAGASGRTLAFGPGHVDGSAEPGEDGLCIIAAHRDTHFALLRNVTRGDVVRLCDRHGRTSEYQVVDLKIVDHKNIPLVGGKSMLLLSTCYPFDAIRPGGPLRFVVVAKRV
jgi:sortase A